MRLKDVKYAVPQIHKEILLNDSFVKLHKATLIGGTIYIDNVYSVLSECSVTDCNIIAEIPVIFTMAIIEDSKEEFNNIGMPEDKPPHACVLGGFFKNCKMPNANYSGCLINGKPQDPPTSDK